MRFSFHRIKTLPKLAWCAVLRRSDRIIQVFHGPWVETQDGFFIEGAWDGRFKDGLFDDSYLLMGSGAKIMGDTILFATPCHPLEKLHFYMTEECVYVSPSMVFLLKLANRRLDMNYLGYEFQLQDLIKGLEHHVQYIPLDDGSKMLLCCYRNVEIDVDLTFRIRHKPEPPGFVDFANYKNFLINGLSRLDRNARDPERTVQYSPLTTISSGYDSCACSALALEIGCTEAATILNARDSYHTLEDSGSVIGEIMGLRVHEYEQDAYKRLPNFPDAEFIAMGGGGPDLVMAPMAELFSQRSVITGIHGDRVWERQPKWRIMRDIIRTNLHGATLTEFRLRVGFIHTPVPFLGCLNYPAIHAISQSEEMSPWSVGGDYDRPIARRLVEEKNVDRNSFGKEKKACTVPMSGRTLDEMKQRMNPQSFHSFMKFCKDYKKKRALQQHIWHTFIFLGYRLTQSGKLRRLFPFLIFFERIRFDEESFRLHWAMSLIENRYEIHESQNEA